MGNSLRHDTIKCVTSVSVCAQLDATYCNYLPNAALTCPHGLHHSLCWTGKTQNRFRRQHRLRRWRPVSQRTVRPDAVVGLPVLVRRADGAGGFGHRTARGYGNFRLSGLADHLLQRVPLLVMLTFFVCQDQQWTWYRCRGAGQTMGAGHSSGLRNGSLDNEPRSVEH